MNNPLDLQKNKNGYKFNKKIFRGLIIILVLLALTGFALNGFELQSYYLKCPVGGGSCFNPLFINTFSVEQSCRVPDVSICDLEVLPEGFVYGNPPNFIIDNFGFLTLLIVLFGFLTNHFLYNSFRGLTK